MDFQSRLELVKKEVEKGLVAFFAKKRQEVKKISPHCLMLVDSVAEFTVRGGKRTRAFLCWLGFQAVSGQRSAVSSKLLHAMMALELFQSFALIHDDIIDEDIVRRGGPTVHVKLGVPMAILAGDLTLVWADELIKKSKRKTPVFRQGREDGKMEDIYQKMKEEVIFGQTLDVVEEYTKPGIPKELIDTYKTAWYTVIRPLQIGACIAGADQTFLQDLASFGLVAGRAYQLRDDRLDGEVSQIDFEKIAKNHERDMRLVIASWHQEKAVTQLFIDFFHFALARPL